MSDNYIKIFACRHSAFSAKNLFCEIIIILESPLFANSYLKMNVNSIVSGYSNFTPFLSKQTPKPMLKIE